MSGLDKPPVETHSISPYMHQTLSYKHSMYKDLINNTNVTCDASQIILHYFLLKLNYLYCTIYAVIV